MTLIDKLPGMTDAEIVNLLANARRLSSEGDERTRTAADGLLPALEAAAAERDEARRAAAPARKPPVRKPAASKAAAKKAA